MGTGMLRRYHVHYNTLSVDADPSQNKPVVEFRPAVQPRPSTPNVVPSFEDTKEEGKPLAVRNKPKSADTAPSNFEE